jgi:protein involved in polysaccharide export with SLBB domain
MKIEEKRGRLAGLLAAAMLLLAGCTAPDHSEFAELNPGESASTGSGTEPGGISSDTLEDVHKLGVGDRVSFRIVEDKEEPKPTLLSDSGELEVPYLGRVPAAGKTCLQLAGEIKAALEKKYYYRATVVISVDVLNKIRGKIYLAGRVKVPGYEDIPTDEVFTVSKAILRAGGFSEFADKRHVKVTRKAENGPEDNVVTIDVARILEKGQAGKDFALRPDDRVFVPSRLVNF